MTPSELKYQAEFTITFLENNIRWLLGQTDSPKRNFLLASNKRKLDEINNCLKSGKEYCLNEHFEFKGE